MNILVLYGSLEGQTRKIAERISEILRNQGQQVTIQSCEKLAPNYSLDDFDAAIIGGSIHTGKYPVSVKKFVTEHCDWLNTIPSAFFTVCMAIHSQHVKSQEEAKRYSTKFIAQTGWQPNLTETFAGAVKYTQYNLVTRFIMKLITRREGGSTDTTRDHEYTDWDSVERFTQKIIDTLQDHSSV